MVINFMNKIEKVELENKHSQNL